MSAANSGPFDFCCLRTLFWADFLENCTWSRDSILAPVAWAQRRHLQKSEFIGKVTFCLQLWHHLWLKEKVRYHTKPQLVRDKIWFRPSPHCMNTNICSRLDLTHMYDSYRAGPAGWLDKRQLRESHKRRYFLSSKCVPRVFLAEVNK